MQKCQECLQDLGLAVAHQIMGFVVCKTCFIMLCKHNVLEEIRLSGSPGSGLDELLSEVDKGEIDASLGRLAMRHKIATGNRNVTPEELAAAVVSAHMVVN